MVLSRIKTKSSKTGKGERQPRPYVPWTAEQIKKAAEGGSRDPFIREDIKTFYPKEGDHEVRFLPPGWDDARHFALQAWVHYGIGPDRTAFLCLEDQKKGTCPICTERSRATAAGEGDYAKSLNATRRRIAYVIDRANEGDGPKIWVCPASVDATLLNLVTDKKTGEVYQLDDPENGYDASFTVVGKGLNKKYDSIAIARRASPLVDDEDLAREYLLFKDDNPIPDILVYYPPDQIEQALAGHTPQKRDDEDGEDNGKPAKKRARDEEVEEEKPKKRAREEPARPTINKKRALKEEEPEEEEEAGEIDLEALTWDDVHEASEDDLSAILEQAAEQEAIDPDDIDEDEELADELCRLLDIENPKAKKLSVKEKLAALKRKK